MEVYNQPISMKPLQTLLLLTLLFMAILACNLPSSPAAIGLTFTPTLHLTSTVWPAASITTTPTVSAIPSFTRTPSPIPISTSTLTDTPKPTPTLTNTPIPTYQVLRGEVIADNVVCHYGPGADYLYKYGLVAGSHLDVIGRIEQGKYIEVQAIGGNNPCWVNPDWMKVNSDLANLRPVKVDETNLPLSRRYKPPASVSAKRNGNSVTVMWAPVILRAGDDSGAAPYLIEAWVCQAGQIKFSPTGWRQTSAVITDEAGCDAPSHARLYAVEKHGYTLWVEIPWPPFP
jgi:hypothetical protein